MIISYKLYTILLLVPRLTAGSLQVWRAPRSEPFSKVFAKTRKEHPLAQSLETSEAPREPSAQVGAAEQHHQRVRHA